MDKEVEDMKILEMCRIQKCSDEFLKERLKTTYPDTIKFKPDNITWYKYFLHVIYYIYKLKEDFSYKYINGNPETVYNQLKNKTVELSDVIAASSIITKDNKYYIFSENHSRIPKCKSTNLSVNVINNEVKCWDISKLFTEIFTQSLDKGKYVDVYLENPFVKSTIPEYELTEDGISKIVLSFKECIYQKKCVWPNVRFHNIDIRKIEYSTTFPYFIDIVYFRPLMDQFIKAIYNAKHQKIIGMIGLDLLMTEVYKNKLLYNFFNIYLSSDSYINDVTKVSQKIMTVPSVQETILDKRLIDNRHGKVLHRIRTQFEELERENQKYLSNEIKKYIMEKLHNVDIEKLYNIWLQIYTLYNNFINGSKINVTQLEILLTTIMRLMSDINLLLMDAYLLARLFRTFPNTSHIPSHIKIIYAGAKHTKTYIEFIEKTFNIIEKYESKQVEENLDSIKININKFLNIDPYTEETIE